MFTEARNPARRLWAGFLPFGLGLVCVGDIFEIFVIRYAGDHMAPAFISVFGEGDTALLAFLGHKACNAYLIRESDHEFFARGKGSFSSVFEGDRNLLYGCQAEIIPGKFYSLLLASLQSVGKTLIFPQPQS